MINFHRLLLLQISCLGDCILFHLDLEMLHGVCVVSRLKGTFTEVKYPMEPMS